ncbi:MAG: hypothetical protein IBJ03_09730 [Gemmatimonadaceae bacterium]|nr:hypothetical protein [Gemmatimonadaceae bacterium]
MKYSMLRAVAGLGAVLAAATPATAPLAAQVKAAQPAQAKTMKAAVPAAAPATAAALPTTAIPGSNVVDVVALDYAFEMPASIPAGLTTLRLTNKGKELHHVYLVKVDAGKTANDVVGWFKAGGPPPAWMKPVGGPNAAVGASLFTTNLEAGKYVALCVIPSPGGPPHVMKGMVKEFTVAPSNRKAVTPTADITLTLSDYALEFNKPLTAGKHIVAVKNNGQQPHEFFFAKLNPGKTPMQMAMFAEKPEGAPPGMPMGGITDILPGATVYIEIDVQKGEYGFMCFTPDKKDGKPHLAHGMIKQISVK